MTDIFTAEFSINGYAFSFSNVGNEWKYRAHQYEVFVAMKKANISFPSNASFTDVIKIVENFLKSLPPRDKLSIRFEQLFKNRDQQKFGTFDCFYAEWKQIMYAFLQDVEDNGYTISYDSFNITSSSIGQTVMVRIHNREILDKARRIAMKNPPQTKFPLQRPKISCVTIQASLLDGINILANCSHPIVNNDCNITNTKPGKYTFMEQFPTSSKGLLDFVTSAMSTNDV